MTATKSELSLATFQEISELHSANIWFYSGPINPSFFKRIRNEFYSITPKQNIILILTTNGGSAHEAYRAARFLKRKYSNFYCFILGRCKSAGTLLALGADEIVMYDTGELGPIDVQMARADEIGSRDSGVDILKGLDMLKNQSFDMFQYSFLKIKKSSAGTITTKTASEIAIALSNGIVSGIASQIDPVRLGAVVRATDVARKYAHLLKAPPKAIEKLVGDYPSHSCIIDVEEARSIGLKVREPSERERYLETALLNIIESRKGNFSVYTPKSQEEIFFPLDVIRRSSIVVEEADELEEENSVAEQQEVNQNPST